MRAAVATGVDWSVKRVGRPMPGEDMVQSAMTRCPISVPADAAFRTVVAVLTGNKISAVPVVDASGGPVGVVSEIDLIRCGLRGEGAVDGCSARDLMTSPVVTVLADSSLSTAARLLAAARVRHLFVVEEGRLVGVLSRRDLLSGYLRDDDAIREQVEHDVQLLLRGRGEVVTVSVRDGVVLLLGRVGWRSGLSLVDDVVAAVPGVVEVRNRMGFFWDDYTARARRRFARSAR